MTELLSPPEAARLIGTNVAQVKEWMRRADHPLPSVPVGQSGKFRKVLRERIPAWLEGEAERAVPAAAKRPTRRRGAGR